MKKIILVGYLLFFSVQLFSQVTEASYEVHHGPEFMLPSTETISRIKHVARPTGTSTGVPEIVIPVWNNENCSYSINLRYHASGIQVNELASSVGLGWSLEVGGVVTRIVRGLPDDLENRGYINALEQINSIYNVDLNQYSNSQSDTLYDIGKYYDTAPDIFYYNFQGNSGKFIFVDDSTIVTVPKSNMRITPEYGEDKKLIAFNFLKPNGLNYRFSAIEKVVINSCDVDLGYTSYTSAWYIGHSRELTKEHVTYGYDLLNPHIETLVRNLYEYDYENIDGVIEANVVSANITIERPNLKYISDINSKVDFVYGSNNELESLSIWGHDERALNDSYKDYDPHTFEALPEEYPIMAEIKKIQFNYGEFETTEEAIPSRKRKLNSVNALLKESDSNIGYNFTYNNTLIPSENSIKADLWGYYNGSSNASLLPQLNNTLDYYESIGLTSESANIPGEYRYTDATYSQAGILTKIENPIGGIIEYEYESQSFVYNSQAIQGGGVRVKSIRTYDPNSEYPEIKVNYSYTDFDNSSLLTGFLLSKPNFAYKFKYYSGDADIFEKTFRYADYSYGLNSFFGNPVAYSQVTVENNGLGYEVKDFELFIPNATDVNIFSNNLQTEITLAKDAEYFIELSYEGKHYRENFCYDWNHNYLTKQRTFDINRNPLKETNLQYTNIQSAQKTFGFYASPGVESTYPLTSDPNNIKTKLHKSLKKFYYPYGWKLLTQKEEISYINGTVFNQISSYEYESLLYEYRFINEVQTTDVDGNIHFEKIRYPFNYPGLGPINEFVDIYEENLQGYITNNESLFYDDNISSVKKSITTTDLVNLPQTSSDQLIQNSNAAVVALSTMLSRKIMATPIEVIKGVIAEGETILTSASLSTYRKLENEQVVQDKTYVLSGPISYDGINLSGIVDDSFVFHEDFRLDQYYSLYSDAGELLFVRNPNGSTINYKWYGLGTYLMSKTINTTHTVTYKYKPLIGILEEVDFSGNSFYYMYDNDGNLIAKKDQDHHIREIYNNNVVNSDGSIIIGENSYSDLDLNPLSDLSISEQSGNLNIELFINSYENIYQYEIDFGDGTIETADHEYISHTYAEAGDFTVKMKVKRNNIVLAQDEEIIDVNLFPMTASFLYVNPTTNDLYGEINNETTNDLNVELSVANGTGNYTVNWEVTHKENPDLSFTETDQITDSVGSSDIDIISNGSYRLKCTITNGEDTIIKTWDFIIE